MKPGSYEKLNEYGFVPENTQIDGGDVIIGKSVPINYKKKDSNYQKKFRDNSTSLRNNESGHIDKVYFNINGDGYLDLIEGTSNQKNQIYYNTGQIGGLFSQSPNWNSQDSHPTSSIALGDIDGDGDNDLVVGNRNEDRKSTRLNSSHW